MGIGLDELGDPLTDASGTPLTPVTDLSDSGSDPNTDNPTAPGHDGAGGTGDPTSLVIPDLGAAKRVVTSTPTGTPGTFEITYEVIFRNLGTVDVTDLVLSENLLGQLGPAYEGIASGPAIIGSTATADPNFDAAWSGNDAANMFDGTSGILRPGEQIAIQFTATVDIDQITATSHNQIEISGSYDPTPGVPGDGGTVTDLSDAGSNPATNNTGVTGDTGGFDDPTLIPALGAAKEHGTIVPGGPDGQEFVVPVSIVIENVGATDLGNLNIAEDLMAQFGAAFVGVTDPLIDASAVTGSAPGANAAWAGDTSQNLLDGTGVLTPGDVLRVSFEVLVDPDATGKSLPLSNQAVVTASDPAQPGLVVQDTSDGGSSTRTTNPGAPGDAGTADDSTALHIPDVGVTKRVVDVEQNGAAFDMTIEFVLENTGTVDLVNLTLNDDFVAEISPHEVSPVGQPAIVSSNATADPSLNAGWSTDISQNMFDGTSGVLAPGESITVRVTVTIAPDYAALMGANLSISNQATGGGLAVDGKGDPLGPVTDLSDSGSDPNGNNPGTLGDTGGWDDTTLSNIGIFAFDSFNDQSGNGLSAFSKTNEPSRLLSSQEQTLDFAMINEVDRQRDPRDQSLGRRLYGALEVKKPQISLDRLHRENTNPLGRIGYQSNLSLNFEHVFDDRGFNDDDIFVDQRDEIDDVLTLYLSDGDLVNVDEHHRMDASLS